MRGTTVHADHRAAILTPVNSRLATLRTALAAWTPALRSPRIRRTILAFFLFNAVEIGTWTAILVYAYGATGPASVGLVSIAQLLPSALLAPPLAGLGGRLGRVAVLRGWYVAMALTVATTGAAILAGLPPLVVYVLATLATLAMTQARPAQAVLFPELAQTPAELTGSNALASVGEGIGAFIGPLLAGLILVAGSPGHVYLAGAVAFAGSVALMLRVRAASGEVEDRETGVESAVTAPGAAARPAPVTADDGGLRAALRTVLADGDLAIVMVLLGARMAIFGGLEVLVVLLSIELLGLGESGAGILFAAVGLGTVVGGVGAFALAGRPRLTPWVAAGAVAVGLALALVGLAPNQGSAIAVLAIGGIGLALTDVAGQTLLQRISPDHLRANVFGLLEGMLLAGEGLGSVIVIPIALALGLEGAAITLGVLLPIAAAVGALRFARIDRRARVPGHELGLLRRVPLFAPLRPPVLEAVARHLVAMPVAAGTRVVVQGEPGDRWYLIESGRFEVAIDGRIVRELGAGDGFGEIALLHDVPRTATVTAAADGSIWSLDRERFLDAVTGSAAAHSEARRVAAERLAADVPR